MPYRAMLATLLTVMLALLVVGLWVAAVTPLLNQANAATMTASIHGAAPAQGHDAPDAGPSDPAVNTRGLRNVIRGTLLLSFVLIWLLLVIGLFATFREWVRARARRSEPVRKAAAYVDAWKLAGERMKSQDQP